MTPATPHEPTEADPQQRVRLAHASSDTVPQQRVRLDVAYEGTDFVGWATQPGQRSVQATVEEALATALRVPVRLHVAGRTDAGVHARGQVAHVDVPADIWVREKDALPGRLAGLLPPDVRVAAVHAVPPEFDARFGALWRRYEYRICDAPAGVDPLVRRHVLSWPRRLDEQAMAQAGAGLVGLHDFVAFCRRREGATAIRTLQHLSVERTGELLTVTVQADAFCHSMVRSLVGALLAVGEGRRAVDWPASLLARDSRANDVAVAPARGLALVAVGYPPDDELAARAAQTAARRELPHS